MVRSSPGSPGITRPLSFDYSDAVELHVGPEKHVLLAFAKFLVRDSAFFEMALKKEWIKGQTRVIKLPEELPHVISHYLEYTYSKRLPSELVKEQPASYLELLAELYILGQRLSNSFTHSRPQGVHPSANLPWSIHRGHEHHLLSHS